MATDDAGNSVLTREYDEYGNIIDEVVTNPSNSPPNAFNTHYAYAGEYLDVDTGYYNLRARWYEPSTGSFLSLDPAFASTNDAYGYASGNPLTYTDPLGLWSTTVNNQSNLTTGAAGLIDGSIGFPVASALMNKISPGSVDNCSILYVGVGATAAIGVNFIPGGTLVKIGGAFAKIGGAFVKAIVKGSKGAFNHTKERLKTRNEDGFFLIGLGIGNKDYDRRNVEDLKEISTAMRNTVRKMQREIDTQKVPDQGLDKIDRIVRVDNPKIEDIDNHYELPHITFKNGAGWYIDGSWKDRHKKDVPENFYPTKKQIKWGEKHGFIRPQKP